MKSPLGNLLPNIEKSLSKILPSWPDNSWYQDLIGDKRNLKDEAQLHNIVEPVNDLISRGGKRWRPILLMLNSHAFGSKHDYSELSAIVEIAHNGTLIVDDIEDGSDERRGDKAVHLKYGIDMAINSANLIYFMPDIVLEKFDMTAETKNRIYQLYFQNMRRVHLGQGLDIQWHNSKAVPSLEDYCEMCRLKTGSLSSMAAGIGAIAAGADEGTVSDIISLWEDVGLGFQILDDMLNVTSGNPGKMRGDDLVEGKKSFLYILLSQIRPEVINELDLLMERASAEVSDKRVKYVEEGIALYKKNGVLELAEEKCRSILNRSLERVDHIYQNNSSVLELKKLIERFIKSIPSFQR